MSVETTMSDAFDRAGYTTVKKRLHQIAGAALSQFCWYALLKLKEISLSELLKNGQNAQTAKDEIGKAIRNETAERESAGSSGRGQSARENRRERAPAAPAPRAALSRAASQAAAVATVQANILDTLMIDGMPLGDCTPEHARSWALNRKRDAKFIEAETANLPLGQPIRK